jgi:hypothetical protein
MKKKIISIFFVLAIAIFSAFSTEFNQTKDDKKTDKTSVLGEKVANVFKQHCSVAGCHKGKYPKQKLNLEEDIFFNSIVNVKSRQVDSLKLVDTKNPQKSYLLIKVMGGTGMVDSKMPVDAPPLTEDEIKIIDKWIISLAEKSSNKEKVKFPESKKKKKLKR